MFEKSAAQLVERLCGQYVEGVDQENLKISMWKGEVTMDQVSLKSTAFDALNLPITLRQGSVGRLHLQVPWNKLGSAPVTITVQDVEAVIVPRVSANLEGETAEERLARLEKEVEAQRKTLLTKTDGDSYLTQMITGVVDNLVIKFERIRIRYEDGETVSGLPFAVELDLGGLSLETADENWNPQAFLSDQKVLHKLGALSALCVRWKSEAHVDAQAALPVLLHPVSAMLKLQVSKTGSVKANRPMVAVEVDVTQLMLSVDQLSLRDAMMLGEAFAAKSRRAQRTGRRPRVPGVVGHAREWWKFAINEVQIQLGSSSASSMSKYARIGREYQGLLKRALKVLSLPELSDAERARMVEIEDEAPKTFIVAVRNGAMIHLRREAEEHVAKHQAAAPSQGIRSRGFGGGGTTGDSEGGMSADERQKMQELIEAAKAKEAELAEELEGAPDDYVAYTFGFKIEAIGARVGSRKSHRCRGAGAGQLEPLAQVQMNLTTGHALMRQRNQIVEASVGRLHIENLPASGCEDQIKKVVWAEDRTDGVPLLDVRVDRFPLPSERPNCKQPLDMSIDVKLQRSVLHVDKAWLERLLAWKAALDKEVARLGIVAPPITAPAKGSVSTAARLVKRVRSQRTLIAITADIQAPTIQVPADTDTAVLKLGRIAVSTLLAEGTGPEKRDDFIVELTDVQLLRGDPAQLEAASELLAPIAATLTVGVATVKDDPDIAQLKAALSVKEVHLSLAEQDTVALAAVVGNLQLDSGAAGETSQAASHEGSFRTGSPLRAISSEAFAQSVSSVLSADRGRAAGEAGSFRKSWRGSQRASAGGKVEPPPKGMEVECMISSLAVTLLAARGAVPAPLMALRVENVDFSRCTHGFATDTRLSVSDFDVTHPSSIAPQAPAPADTVTVVTARGKEDLLKLHVVQTATCRFGQEIQDLEVTLTMGRVKFGVCPPSLEELLPLIQRFSLSPAATDADPSSDAAVETRDGRKVSTKAGGKEVIEVVEGSKTLTFKISSVDFRLMDLRESKVLHTLHASSGSLDLLFIKNRDGSTRFECKLPRFEIDNETEDVSSKRRKVLTSSAERTSSGGTEKMVSINFSTTIAGEGEPNARKMSARMARLNAHIDAKFFGTVQRLVAQLQAVKGTSADAPQTSGSGDKTSTAPAQDSGPLEVDLNLAGFTLFVDRPTNAAEGVEVQVRELITHRDQTATAPDVVAAGIKAGVVVLCEERKGEGAGKGDGADRDASVAKASACTVINRCHMFDIEGRVELERFFGGAESPATPPEQRFKQLTVTVDKVGVSVEEQSVKLAHAILVEAYQALSDAGTAQAPPKAQASTPGGPTISTTDSAVAIENGDKEQEGVKMVIEGVVKEFVFSFREYSPPVHEALKPIKAAYRDQALALRVLEATTSVVMHHSGARDFRCLVNQFVIECEDIAEHPASKARLEDDGRLVRRLLASQSEDRFVRKTKTMETSLRALFRKHDQSSNSKLNVDELMTTLRDVGVCFSEEQCQVLLDQLDVDGDGEVDEQEFMGMMWLSLGEQPPDSDLRSGDSGPQSPGTARVEAHAAPFVSIQHSKKASGAEELDVHFARLELDLALEPLGMAMRLQQFLSTLSSDDAAAVQPEARPVPAVGNGVGELWGVLGRMQTLKAPYEAGRGQAVQAMRPPPRDILVRVDGMEVCVVADNQEEKAPAVFLWLGKLVAESRHAKPPQPDARSWEHARKVVVEDLEVGYSDKLVGKYDQERKIRKDHDVILKRNTFKFEERKILGFSAAGVDWTKSTESSIDRDIEVEVALSHLVFLKTFSDALQTRWQLEGESDDEDEDADEDAGDAEGHEEKPPGRKPKREASESKPKTPKTSKQSKGMTQAERAGIGQDRRASAPALKEDTGPRIASQAERWSLSCGQAQVVLRDDLQKNLPLVKMEVSNLVLSNQIETGKSELKAEVEVSCSMYTTLRMDWEPVLERWRCSATAATSRSALMQRLTVDAPTRLELTLAPEHVCGALQAQSRFKETLKQSKMDLITEAPTLKRFTSSKQINEDLSSFFAKFTPDSTRLFHNRTSLDLRLRVLSDNANECFNAVLPPTKTAYIDFQQIGLLQIQPVMLSVACEWSAPLAGLAAQPQPELFKVVCSGSDGAPAAHLHLCCTATEIHASSPWSLQNLLPVPATISLHRGADPASPAYFSTDAEPGPLLQQFGADLTLDDVYLSIVMKESSLKTVENVHIGNGSPSDLRLRLIEKRDDGDRDLELRIHLAQFDRGSKTLRIYPQLVMVNRTGLPLVFGRCRDRRADTTVGEVDLEVEIVGGQEEHELDNLHSAAGWTQEEDVLTEEHQRIHQWKRSAAEVKDAEGGSWNVCDPLSVMLSLPEGPEWSPCVEVLGSGKWIEIANDEKDDNQDLGDSQGRFIKLRGAMWHAVDDDHDGTIDRVEEGAETSYSLGLTMKMGDIPFHRTIYMDFMPLHNIVNRTDQNIQVAQYERGVLEDVVLQVEPQLLMSTFGAFLQGDHLGGFSTRLVVRFVDDDGSSLTHWSGPFELERGERTFPLRLCTEEDEKDDMHVVCEIRRWSQSNFINFLPHDESSPLYQVNNNTARKKVAVWQLGSLEQESRAIMVDPGKTRMLSWDDADSLLKLGVRIGACKQVAFIDMNKLGEKGTIRDGSDLIAYQCRISGSTRCLEIKDVQRHVSEKAEDELILDVAMNFGGVGLSVVDTQRVELLYASLQSLALNFTVSDSKVKIKASVLKLHVDNQTLEGPRKAIIFPLVAGNNPKPLTASAELNREVVTMPYWNKVEVLDSEFCVQLQEDWLYQLLQFEEGAFNGEGSLLDDNGAASLLVRSETGTAVELEQMIRTLSFLETADGTREQGVHIEQLRLSAMEGDVSVYGLYAVPSRPEKPSVGPVSSIYQALRVVQAPMGSVPDIHRHHIKLPALTQEDVALIKGHTIGKFMWLHYKTSLYRGAVKLMGSADFWASVLGAASDTKASALERQKQKAMQRAQGRPETVGSGLSQGFTAVGEGFMAGLTGMVEKPMEAAKEGGTAGFFQGIGQGLLGAFTKPAAGMLELGSKVTEGTLAQVKGVERVPREREPRAVYQDKKLRAYNKEDAESYLALCELSKAPVEFVGFAAMDANNGLLVADGTVRVVYRKNWGGKGAWSAKVQDLFEVKWDKAECRLQLVVSEKDAIQNNQLRSATFMDRDRGQELAKYLESMAEEKQEPKEDQTVVLMADGRQVPKAPTDSGSASDVNSFFAMMPPPPQPSQPTDSESGASNRDVDSTFSMPLPPHPSQ